MRSIKPRIKLDGSVLPAGIIATVFGGSGFIGGKLINRLGQAGVQVVIPFRGEENSVRHLRPLGDLGQFIPVRFDIRDYDTVLNAIEHSNVVINLLGRNWGTTHFPIESVNTTFAETIAKASKEVGIEKLIHFSAEGVSPKSVSELLKSKFEGENKVREIFPDAVIIRPCHVFGLNDTLFSTIANQISMTSRSLYLPLDAHGLVQPLYVSDLVTGILQLLSDTNNLFGGEVFHLG